MNPDSAHMQRFFHQIHIFIEEKRSCHCLYPWRSLFYFLRYLWMKEWQVGLLPSAAYADKFSELIEICVVSEGWHFFISKCLFKWSVGGPLTLRYDSVSFTRIRDGKILFELLWMSPWKEEMLLGHSLTGRKKEAKNDRVCKMKEQVWANADATPCVAK